MKIIFKIIFTVLFLFSSSTYAEVLELKMVNLKHIARQLPPHDFAYEIKIPQDEASDSPLKGKISYDVPTKIDLSRSDRQEIVSNLTITDPAMQEIIIWKGKIKLNANTHQISYITTEQNLRYLIEFKFPSVNIPTFEIDILAI